MSYIYRIRTKVLFVHIKFEEKHQSFSRMNNKKQQDNHLYLLQAENCQQIYRYHLTTPYTYLCSIILSRITWQLYDSQNFFNGTLNIVGIIIDFYCWQFCASAVLLLAIIDFCCCFVLFTSIWIDTKSFWLKFSN